MTVINGHTEFTTMDNRKHDTVKDSTWDLLIAHPPCTYITKAGAVRLFNADHTIRDMNRYIKGWNAAVLFPTPMKCFGLPSYTQAIEPFMFGDPWRKRTCLWLNNLPNLIETDRVEPRGLWVGSTSGRRDGTVYSRYELKSKRDSKTRSKTFPGIATAMAEQWGSLI